MLLTKLQQILMLLQRQTDWHTGIKNAFVIHRIKKILLKANDITNLHPIINQNY